MIVSSSINAQHFDKKFLNMILFFLLFFSKWPLQLISIRLIVIEVKGQRVLLKIQLRQLLQVEEALKRSAFFKYENILINTKVGK